MPMYCYMTGEVMSMYCVHDGRSDAYLLLHDGRSDSMYCVHDGRSVMMTMCMACHILCAESYMRNSSPTLLRVPGDCLKQRTSLLFR